MGPRALSILGLSFLALSCTVQPLALEGRECPCVAGWVCDEALDECVPIAGDASSTRDGGVVRRDGGPTRDGGRIDSGPPRDGGTPDVDGGPPPPDGGSCMPTTEECNGVDDDCDGEVDEDGVCPTFDSCAAALASGETGSGVYLVNPDATSAVSVYCDMTTDGGGWTLVGSTLTTPLADERSDYYGDLASLAPAGANRGVWHGLRGRAATFDMRFACRASPGAGGDAFTVDLSFYDVNWYLEFTTGTDAECCFSEANGVGDDDPPPARRNNIDGTFLDVGDPWNTEGFLEGEDQCDDTTDFTVDFDERGMDGDQSDGTDWGEDDGMLKCGTTGLMDGQWFIFVRER